MSIVSYGYGTNSSLSSFGYGAGLIDAIRVIIVSFVAHVRRLVHLEAKR